MDLSPVACARRPARERRQTAAMARAPPDIAPTRRTSRFLYRHSATTSNNIVDLLAIPSVVATSVGSAKIAVSTSSGASRILHYHPRTNNKSPPGQGSILHMLGGERKLTMCNAYTFMIVYKIKEGLIDAKYFGFDFHY